MLEVLSSVSSTKKKTELTAESLCENWGIRNLNLVLELQMPGIGQERAACLSLSSRGHGRGSAMEGALIYILHQVSKDQICVPCTAVTKA